MQNEREYSVKTQHLSIIIKFAWKTKDFQRQLGILGIFFEPVQNAWLSWVAKNNLWMRKTIFKTASHQLFRYYGKGGHFTSLISIKLWVWQETLLQKRKHESSSDFESWLTQASKPSIWGSSINIFLHFVPHHPVLPLC